MTHTTIAQPSVLELWAAYAQQRETVDALSAKHSALCEQANEVLAEFMAAAAELRKLFEAAFEAEFGRKFYGDT